MPEHHFIVDLNDDHQRLDVFLTKHLVEGPSRTFVRRLIDNGRATVNKKIAKPHHQVVNGDQVMIDIPESDDREITVAPEDIALDIVYEDPFIMVINKPAGMMVHPARGQYSGTLVNALLHYGHTLSDGSAPFRPGIVHRLDRDTSGLVVVAKDNRTHVRLARQFEKHRIRKRYVAVVKGCVEFDEGVIDAPLGRHPRYFDKKTVTFDDERGKPSRTFYRVLKRFDPLATLVALFPESGRTHQLRVHMVHLGHPILGDDKYGNKDSFFRLALHAQAIKFQHPQTRHDIEFFIPMPLEFCRSFSSPDISEI
jgi:23S rRNA pseudouridine1911/1915/1917 synthase